MREIILDTETTGLDPNDGHRLVEIGCVEMASGLPTGRTWHYYFNPERDMPQEAQHLFLGLLREQAQRWEGMVAHFERTISTPAE